MLLRPAVFSLALFLNLTVVAPTVSAADDMQVRIAVENQNQIRRLAALGLDIVSADATAVEILTGPAVLETLQQLGFKTEIVHESAGEFYRSRLEQKTMGGYKTLAELYAYLDAMIADHPDLISARQSIGLTIEGRDLWAVKISDNPNVDEDEPEVLYTAAIHCREVATPEVLFHFMDYLTNNYDSDPDVQALVDEREIWFIVACNPDGYFYNQVIAPGGGGLWRRNRRDNGNGTFGVDLNRNFGYQWGYDDVGSSPAPGSDTYRGSAPFSEPETQALRDFVLAHEFVLTIHYHSYANIFLFPWGYVRQNSADDDLFRAMGDTVNAMNGYVPGLVGELLYPVNGGVFDWEYGEQTLKNKVLSTSIEVGRNSDGFWPTLTRLAEIKAENLQPLLFMTRLAGHVNRIRPPSPPQITPAEWVDGAAYDVTWTETDPDNPAVMYELVELRNRRIATDSGDNLDFWFSDGFAASTVRAYSGAGSLFSGSDDGYVAHLTTTYPYLVNPGDHLTFQTFFDMDFYRDFGYVEVSADGQNFVSVPGNLTSNFNPYGGNRGNGISGSSGEWTAADFDLAAFAGQQLWFRFTYETDASDFGEGWYLDDIYPHLVFDSRVVVASDLTTPAYTFTNRPLDVYYYQVRAKDAENQWSDFSTLERINVLGAGTADIDLDGIAASAGDLALFSLYFDHGLSAFDINLEQQTGATDINCDAITLSVADLVALAQVVTGAATPCYSPAPAEASRVQQEAASLAATEPTRAAQAGEALFAVALQTTTFPGNDSIMVDLILTDTDASLIGCQFHLEYDASALNLQEVRRGDAIAPWQYFDSHIATNAGLGEATVAATAQYQGADVAAGDIQLPAPAQLARLKFSPVSAGAPLNTTVSFVWNACGDNSLVVGSLNGTDLQVDSLALSRVVLDADGIDVTGLTSRYGGADQSCLYGLFGGAPAPTVDYASARIVISGGCCVDRVGDVNGEGGDVPTIGDISMLIDHLFVSGIELPCLTEADINQSGGTTPTSDDITIGDVSLLIDHLFISGAVIPTCL